MAQKKKADPNNKLIAENRRARFDYAIEDTLECGMVLMGSEVKSMREGQTQITESYVDVEDGELWLINSYVSLYAQAKTFGHTERRKRKLLVSRREIARLWQGKSREGMTIVPLKIYFNNTGKVKCLIGLAKGKNKADKRDTQRDRDWNKQKRRLLKEHG
ncbi:MAG: SsrA-binding protein SmpB [Pseudomonadota bacterium]